MFEHFIMWIISPIVLTLALIGLSRLMNEKAERAEREQRQEYDRLKQELFEDAKRYIASLEFRVEDLEKKQRFLREQIRNSELLNITKERGN